MWHLLIIVSQWWSFCIVTFMKWQEQSMWHCNNNQWLCCNATFTKVHVALWHLVILLCHIVKSIIVLSSILYEERFHSQSFFKTKFSIVRWFKNLKNIFCSYVILAPTTLSNKQATNKSNDHPFTKMLSTMSWIRLNYVHI